VLQAETNYMREVKNIICFTFEDKRSETNSVTVEQK
jgi:hypothetical protein